MVREVQDKKNGGGIPKPKGTATKTWLSRIYARTETALKNQGHRRHRRQGFVSEQEVIYDLDPRRQLNRKIGEHHSLLDQDWSGFTLFLFVIMIGS